MAAGRPLAVIFGCSGLELTADERAFFRAADPLGFILFRRNCATPDQVRGLTAQLRDAVGRADAPILIDQEGGRVQRLRPPEWPDHPAAGRFARLAERDPDAAERAVALNARSIALMLHELGITVDAAPVLDLLMPGASAVVGDRSLGRDPQLVARLGRAATQGLLDGGVVPIVKHMPGHGRAVVDSHCALPVVDAGPDALDRMDFVPFRALADRPWGMTAHVVYAAIDADRPATLSPTVIAEIIRGRIGFDGVLVSDDLTMGALAGPVDRRAADALAAGCDVALHCSGALAEMDAVARAVRPIGAATAARLERAAPAPRPSGDGAALRAEVARLMGDE